MIGVKTQTRRSTLWKEKVINANLILDGGFELGIITSKSWGDFGERTEPLVTITIEKPGKSQIQYEIPLGEFIDRVTSQ
jgi:hypothetical protein